MSRWFGDTRQVGIVVRDIEAAMRHWVSVCGVGPWFYIDQAVTSVYRAAREGDSERGRFVYFRNEGHPGTVIEMAHATPARMRIFGAIRDAAAGWDGSDPIRRQWPS